MIWSARSKWSGRAVPMAELSTRRAVAVAALLIWAQAAQAHGIAGNRYFDGTLTFDDPAVADEAILPYYAQLAFPAQGSNTSENRLNWAFARLLTPTLAFTADGGWLHQNWPIGHTSGADKVDIGLKYDRALKKLGIHVGMLSSEAGHA